jgi:hypothetical protein
MVPENGSHRYQAIAFNDRSEQIGASQAVIVSINKFQGSQPPMVSLEDPGFCKCNIDFGDSFFIPPDLISMGILLDVNIM